MAGNAPYSRSAEGSDQSSVWIIEGSVPPDVASQSAGGTVLFASQPVQDYPQGALETELHRGVLFQNEVSECRATTGPALLMIASGRVEATVGANPPQTIGAGAGMMVNGEVSLRDAGIRAGLLRLASFGTQLQGSEAPAPTQRPLPPPDARRHPGAARAGATGGRSAGSKPRRKPRPNRNRIQQTGSAGAAGGATSQSDSPATPTATACHNVDEARLGTDPLNTDYDGDGLLDGAEVYQYGTDPVNNDTDGDGLLDGEEVTITAPARPRPTPTATA